MNLLLTSPRPGRFSRLAAGLGMHPPAWVDDSPPDPPPFNGVFVRPDGVAIVVGAQGAVFLRPPDGAWRRWPTPEGTEVFSFHAVVATRAPWLVGGRLSLGRGGVVVTAAPAPHLELTPPPPLPDAAVPDLGPPIDLGVDAASPDASDGAAPEGGADLGVVDARPPDIRPDLDLTGRGEICPPACPDGLDCWSFAGIGFAFRCSLECQDVAECAGYADPCCGIPGPNVLVRVCGERPWYRPGDCPE